MAQGPYLVSYYLPRHGSGYARDDNEEDTQVRFAKAAPTKPAAKKKGGIKLPKIKGPKLPKFKLPKLPKIKMPWDGLVSGAKKALLIGLVALVIVGCLILFLKMRAAKVARQAVGAAPAAAAGGPLGLLSMFAKGG